MQRKKKVKSNSKGDSKLFIFSGLIASIMFLTWFVFLHSEVFINSITIILLIFVPGSVLAGFFYIGKDLIKTFTSGIKRNINSSFSVLEYLFVTLAIGNTILTAFLLCNILLAEKETKEVILEPFNLGESYYYKDGHTTSHLEVTFDGISKRIKFGTRPLNSMYGYKINVKVSKGFFGFYIIRELRLE